MHGLCRQLAGIVLGWAVLTPAHCGEPFPDQPGALSSEEIQRSREALKLLPMSGVPGLDLVASGRRGDEADPPEKVLFGFEPARGSAYALFAAPHPVDSERAKITVQFACNTDLQATWHCERPHYQVRISANGIDHVFLYVPP